ncbi:MAG: orotate phosphoribosyltransferase [Dehalococcoidales bacterium]|nr:orotate phosphoribosyltransferase [Dehalococcoidales bacterium]
MADKIEEIFNKSGAVLHGHFLLTSGMHSPVYWEKFKILQYPQYTEQLCRLIADHFRGQKIDVVAGPTTGGIILAYEVARQLGVRSIYAEKEDNLRVFRRSLSISPGERVLVVDDILTTGGSARQVVDAVKKLQGNVIGVGILVDRSENRLDFGAPFFTCLRSEAIAYTVDNCPLCAGKIPLVKPGGG